MLKPNELKETKKDCWQQPHSYQLNLEHLLDGIVKVNTKRGRLTEKGGILSIPDSIIRGQEDVQKARSYFAQYDWEIVDVNGPKDHIYEFEIRPSC